MKEIAIRFMSEVNRQSINNLLAVMEAQVNSGVERIHLLISSPGGSVSDGIAAYNFIKGIPIEVFTYNFGSIDSIASVIYSAGSKRFSVPNARFLVHSVKINFPQGAVMEESQLKETESGLKIDRHNVAKILADNCNKPQEEIEKMMLDARLLNPEEAKEFGFVHEIKTTLLEAGIQVINVG